MGTPLRNKLVPVAAAALFLTGTATTTAAAEPRSALDGACQSGELCLYYNSDHAGSLADFELGVKDFATVRFVSAGAGKGQQVKNNAASACNKDDNLTARVHYNSNWEGAYDSIPPGTCRNLVKTYNQNASFVWIAG